MMATDQDREGFHAGRIAGGFIILALGALMLLDRNDVFGQHAMRFFPGIAVMLIGVAQLMGGSCERRGYRRSGFGGVWLIIVGAWLLANQGHLLGLTFHTSWPLLIIAVGVLIVAREVTPGGRDRDRVDGPHTPQER